MSQADEHSPVTALMIPSQSAEIAASFLHTLFWRPFTGLHKPALQAIKKSGSFP